MPCSSNGKEPACNAGDQGLLPGLGSSSGEGNGNLLRYSCLENPTDRETWWATVHGVTRAGHNSATNTHTCWEQRIRHDLATKQQQSIFMSVPLSQFAPLSPFPLCAHLFSVSLFLPCKYVHLYHFSRFHRYVLVYCNLATSFCKEVLSITATPLPRGPQLFTPLPFQAL